MLEERCTVEGMHGEWPLPCAVGTVYPFPMASGAMTLAELELQAMALPAEERKTLGAKLLASTGSAPFSTAPWSESPAR